MSFPAVHVRHPISLSLIPGRRGTNSSPHTSRHTDIDAIAVDPSAPPRPGRRVALLGMFGIGNMGNDASMETMLRFLREEARDCSVHCLAVDPEAIRRTYGVETIHLNSRFRARLLFRLDKTLFRIPGGLVDLVRTIYAAHKFDLLVAPGTGLLDDFGTGPFHWPYTLLKWCVAARLCGAQIWLVSIGAGPVQNPLSRWMMKKAARLARYRSYRDRISLEFMREIGFDTGEDAVYPDIVFKMETPPAAVRMPSPDGKVVVGVGVMGYKGWHAWEAGGAEIYASYLSRITSLIVWLLDNSYGVRLFTGARSDGETIEEIVNRLAAMRPKLNERCVAVETHSLVELVAQMSAVDVTVATRFHNVICSLKAGKPTISLGYARKNDVLMAEFGLGEYCQRVEDFDVRLLKVQIADILENREGISASILSRLDELKAELERQDRHLLSEMLG
jgi:polysaccharide pyruvyl transferase WcaK-like protein